MSTTAWILVGLVALSVILLALQTVIGFANPKGFSGRMLLRQELRRRGVPNRHLPPEFFAECVVWAYGVSQMTAGPSFRLSPLKTRAEFVRTIRTIADMAALWRQDPTNQMFRNWGARKSFYQEVFEKYDLRAQLGRVQTGPRK